MKQAFILEVKMTKVWRLLSILIIPLMCLGLVLVPAAQLAQQALAASPDWGYNITPNTTTVGFNTDFNVTVSAVCYDACSADTWQIMVDFDQTYLQVIGITQPALLPTGDAPDPYPGEPTLNNTTGWVYDGYGVQPLKPTVNVTFAAWTIHFRSKNVTTGSTYLNFVYVDPYYSTQAVLGGTDYLNWTHVVNGTVRIGSPTLTVNVTPAGNGTVKANGVTLTGYPNTTNRSWDEVVNLNATTSVPNWTFDHWSGALNGSANPINITMNDNKNVMANFASAAAGATLEGHVSFSGRGTAPDSKWIEPFVVRFFQGGSEMAWSPINATTNNTGVFNITGVTPGTYNVSIKNWTCLSEVVTGVTLTAGNTTVVNFGTTREGDSNNDDWIVLSDRTILYTGWGSQSPNPGYNAHADFNRDGWLTLADRTIMYTYWAQHGDLI
jgi:hypothetical protein